MRDILTVSQIHKVLLKVGYVIMIGNLKSVVKELGFEWNGKSVSILTFINTLKSYINPEKAINPLETADDVYVPKLQKLELAQTSQILSLKKSDGSCDLIELIKDMFYSSG